MKTARTKSTLTNDNVEVAASKYIQADNEDLTHNLRYLLCFGRIIGVIPISGMLAGRTENLKFRWKSAGVFLNCFITILMLFNVTIGLILFFKKDNMSALEITLNSRYWTQHLVALFNYMFFLLKAKDLIQILHSWELMKFHYNTKTTNATREINLISICIFGSIICENILWHLKGVGQANQLIESLAGKGNATVEYLEAIYISIWPVVAAIIPYHSIILTTVFITNKFCLASREFGDVFLIVISRSIYLKFKHLIQSAKTDELALQKYPWKWELLMQDFNTLLEIIRSLAKFLSPLVFLSFSFNIYYISLRLCVALQVHGNMSAIDRIFASWSFLHGIIRCYLVVLSGARINECALKIRSVLEKCPQDFYSPQVQRFESQVNHNEIGLNGFGCFAVTNTLILKLISVIFTIEIVLLQSTDKQH